MALSEEEMNKIKKLLSKLKSNNWESAMEQLSDDAPDMLRELLKDIEYLQGEKDAWIKTALQATRNREYYRKLCEEASAHLGPEVFIQSDGGIVDSPLLAKVPELVEKLRSDSILEAARLAVNHGQMIRDDKTFPGEIVRTWCAGTADTIARKLSLLAAGEADE